MPGRLPLLWIYGPPGVGKSTVGWRIFQRLHREGTPVAFVDIDQLGMCYPEPDGDPGRYDLKLANLRALVGNAAAAGARALVVAGVVDPSSGVQLDPTVVGARAVACRLRLRPDALAERLRDRGDPADNVDLALVEAEQLEQLDQQPVVDVDGLTVDQAADRVRLATGGWPPRSRLETPAWPNPSAPADGPPVLWVCGPPAVGKSTVGFEAFSRLLRSEGAAAYLDLAQLGLLRPAPLCDPLNHRLKAANLAAVRAAHGAAGARWLVISGPVEDQADVEAYARALAGSRLTLCQLEAGWETLRRRIEARGRGEGWPDASDPLAGASPDTIERAWRHATGVADRLHAAPVADITVATDGRPPGEIAGEMLSRAWGQAGPGGRLPARGGGYDNPPSP